MTGELSCFTLTASLLSPADPSLLIWFLFAHQNCRQSGWPEIIIFFTPVYLHGAPEHIHMRSNPILPKGARCKDVDYNSQWRGD